MSKEWDPDEVKRALDMDVHYAMDQNGTKPSMEAIAKKKLREGVPLAVAVLSQIMLHSDNEPLRARCAQYWIDRVIGKVDATPLVTSGDDDKIRELLEGVITNGNSN